jgi:hypothetical protein
LYDRRAFKQFCNAETDRGPEVDKEKYFIKIGEFFIIVRFKLEKILNDYHRAGKEKSNYDETVVISLKECKYKCKKNFVLKNVRV